VLANGETVPEHVDRNDLLTAGRLGFDCCQDTEFRCCKMKIQELP
jgi:hypothetical protein